MRCHVKVLDLSLPDNLMRVFTFGGAPLRHVAWSAVVVEQLVLAANAEGDGLSAAWMVTRWALLVGIDEVSMEYPHVARPGQDELVAAHVVNAFRGMLPATPPRHFVIDSWLGRLNSASASAAFTYERDLLGRHEQLVTGVAEQWLKDQYAEIAVQLRNILQVLNSQSLPTTRWSDTDVTSSSTAGTLCLFFFPFCRSLRARLDPEQLEPTDHGFANCTQVRGPVGHSLGKAAFTPAGRMREERAAVFA